MMSSRRIRSYALTCAAVVLLVACLNAQQAHPYASIASNGVSYAGPGRDNRYDLTGTSVRIGLLVPLTGPQKAEGEAIVAAARLALEDSPIASVPGGRNVALAIEDESGSPWGRSADALIHLVIDEQVIAVVTSANGATTHVCEQVGNRIGVPILALSSDATTTQINIPWLFRLGSSDKVQAQLFAHDIYLDRTLRNVLLVTQQDHDGRVGGEEFQRAAAHVGAPTPTAFAVDPLRPDTFAWLTLVQTSSPQAIVFWTSSATARFLLQRATGAKIKVPIYLSGRAAEGNVARDLVAQAAGASESGGIWTVESQSTSAGAAEDFGRRYESSMGRTPSALAAEAFDAVRLVNGALHSAGANRARVRDRLAAVNGYPGASGRISFDNEGNSRRPSRLVRIR